MSEYPSTLDIKPLTTWPGQLTRAADRKRSQFSAPMRQTLQLLDKELWYLSAKHPVLEVAIEPGQFRINGEPRTTARAEHPGVVLSLPTTIVGPLRYAADTFTTWQENLRAIALGLEALRKVERYGITRRGEQYVGFKALPPGGDAIAMGGMSRDQALAFLRSLMNDPDAAGHMLPLDQLIRRVKAKAHPDRNNGDRSLWDQVEAALRVLGEA